VRDAMFFDVRGHDVPGGWHWSNGSIEATDIRRAGITIIMPKVVALYRDPVKGFTPEPVEHITVLPGGRCGGGS
ncbi:MAG: hypothetical protein K8S22_01450, partial [Betaproteobacteria bacterium]|nr:hypothetical protein [Betaproteobacteria bacterium]